MHSLRAVPASQQPGVVSVTAPARLHLGFMDLHGGLDRRFGSLGLALDQPAYQLTLRSAPTLSAQGPDAQRAERYVRSLHAQCGWPEQVQIDIESAIPSHSGLGSGTQLALAVGLGLARLYDIPATPSQIAGLLGRGARSGIGVGAFEQGGFMLDGGRHKNHGVQQVPPLIFRQDFPAEWRVLLIFERSRKGLSGAQERTAFSELPEFPEHEAGRLCRQVLMGALPALAEADFQGFGEAISLIQQAVGDYFAPAQGGRYASPSVAAVLNKLEAQGRVGLGQSSWGPTGFVLCPDQSDALRLQAELEAQEGAFSPLQFMIGMPRNEPGLVCCARPGQMALQHDPLQRTAG